MFEKQDEKLILVINEEETEKLIDYQITPEGDRKEETEYPTLTLKDALKLKELYIIAFIFSFCVKSVSSYIGYYKAYGQTFITDDHFLTSISVLGTITTIPGRLLWGFILDKVRFKVCYLKSLLNDQCINTIFYLKKVYAVLIPCSMVLACTLSICHYLSSKWLYMFYYVISDFGVVGIMITHPKIYLMFGHHNLVLIHGVIKFFEVSFC
jgi:hypothetical protein